MPEIIEELLARKANGQLKPDDVLFESDNRPLSEKEFNESESALGFRLPPLMRRIYTEVANGGFGPQYGLLGLCGGMKNEEGCDALSQYESYRENDPEDSHWFWPEALLPLGHLGCAMYLCVDCSKANGSVILFEPNPHQEGQPWDSSFIPFAESFEKWIRAWISGEDLFDNLMEE